MRRAVRSRAAKKRDADNYDEGFKARLAGIPYVGCPYPEMDLMGRLAWGWGWKIADQQMKLRGSA